MFVDTSAIIALLMNEPEARAFAERLASAKTPLTSALVILEASMRLSSLLDLDPRIAETRIRALLAEAGISVVSIDSDMATLAVAAFATYGKGRGHPAQLNLADCMSYACSKANGVPLLFKGNDFSETDVSVS